MRSTPLAVATVLGTVHIAADRPDLAFRVADAIGLRTLPPTSAVLPTDTDTEEG